MAATTIVCLHGLGRSPSDWDAVRGRLETLGSVVVPHLPADAVAAEQVASGATPARAILIGHSRGGVIAMRLAADPARIVQGVVATSSFFPPARNGRSVRSSVHGYASHRIALVRELRSRTDVSAGSGTRPKDLRFLAKLAVGRDLRTTMDAITAPVLVVHAADDHYVPIDFARAAAIRRPHWEMATLESGGHYPHVTRPGEWLDVVRPWIRRTTDDGAPE